MARSQDKDATNSLILELAKSNKWMSRDDLEKKTSKPQKTIIAYLEKDADISELVDRNSRDFFETVNRRTGETEMAIIKYRLNPGLNNLSAVFKYLNDRQSQKQILETEYFRSQIPDIENKIKSVVIKQDVLNNKLKEVLKLAYASPTTVEIIINFQDNTFNHIYSLFPGVVSSTFSKSACLIRMIMSSVTSDLVTGVITYEALVKTISTIDGLEYLKK